MARSRLPAPFSETLSQGQALASGVRQTLKRWLGERPLSRGVHGAVKKAFEKAGFRFELRSLGERRIGLWRWSWRTPEAGALGTPRRFVFVPGFGDTPLSWLPLLVMLRPVLSGRYDELVIVDFPGFGGFLSEDPAIESMDLLLESFFHAIDTVAPHAIMGHSLGGWLATTYCLERGKTGKAPAELIVVNASGVFGTPERKEGWKNQFDRVMELGFDEFRPHLFRKEPFWFGWIAHEFAPFMGQPEVQAFMRSIDDRHILDGRLGEIPSRAWILWGEDDTLIPSSWSDCWLDEFRARGAGKEAHRIRIPGAGHSPHIEKGAATLAALTSILRGKVPPSGKGSRFFWKVD